MLIVAFGDSITHCADQLEADRWTSLLAARMASTHVINAGIGGNTSAEGLARLEQDVLAYHPDVVLVEFGGNDATPEEGRHVAVEDFVENLERMREAIERAGARMVLLTFPPIIDEWHGWTGNELFDGYDGPDGYIEQYREATRAFAQEHGLSLIDTDRALRDQMALKGVEKYVQEDGVHLTAEGNQFFAAIIAARLGP